MDRLNSKGMDRLKTSLTVYIVHTKNREQRRQYEIPCDNKMQTYGTMAKQVCVFLQNWFTEIVLTNLS
jgi:hypothetical protein